MDNLWQRHRTFILKIGGGLAVVLLCWIIGSSLSGSDFDLQKALADKSRNDIRNLSVHSEADIGGFEAASEELLKRINFLARKAGETREGEDLRVGLIRDLLTALGMDPAEKLDEYLKLSRLNPQSCLGGLVGVARTRLSGEASLKNVVIDENLGFDRVQTNSGQLDRYLQTLKLVVNAVKIGIEEGVFEVRQIGILTPPGGRFEGEETFLKEYPVSVVYRGPSVVLLRVLDRLNDPKNLYPIRALRRFQKDRQEKEEDVLVMDLELMALRVLPAAELMEGRR